MMKLADVYERNDVWYFQSSSRATNGLWIATTPIVRVNKDESRRCKYEAAIEVLGASQDGVPIPADNEDLVAPILELARVKSWSEFMRKGKCIALELDGNQLSVIPHKKLGRKGALEGIVENAIVLSADASPDEIGAALEQAMKLSE